MIISLSDIQNGNAVLVHVYLQKTVNSVKGINMTSKSFLKIILLTVCFCIAVKVFRSVLLEQA